MTAACEELCEESREFISSCEEEVSRLHAMEPDGPPPPLELVMCMPDGTELPQSEWESSSAALFSDGFWAKITRDNDTIIKFGECPYTFQDICSPLQNRNARDGDFDQLIKSHEIWG